jgi:sugar phosphate isomerase/epimerase
MIRLGGPVFLGKEKAAGVGEIHGAKDFDPVPYARKYREKGFTAAYAPQIDIKNKELIKATREAFKREKIIIAETQYWENINDTDAESRIFHREKQVEALYLAEELGAVCSINVCGTYCHGNKDHAALNFSDEAFEAAVEMARYFIDTVKPKTACFAYEITPFSVVDSAESIERLIKAIDRKMFGAHIDLANLVNCPRAYFSTDKIAKECVRRFGDRIVSCHVKDIKMEDEVVVLMKEVVSGTGNLDLKTFMRQIEGLSRPIPFMMEHLRNEEEYDKAAANIRKVGKELGIKL